MTNDKGTNDKGMTKVAMTNGKTLVFAALQEIDGGFCAECLSENIFTQGDTWEALRQNVQEAVRCHFFDNSRIPNRIRLHLVRDEVLTTTT
jgi:predicted RNase H-like HicB family nuclease